MAKVLTSNRGAAPRQNLAPRRREMNNFGHRGAAAQQIDPRRALQGIYI